MIRAVIFDLNGVFIKSPKLSVRFYEKFGVGEEKFWPALKEIMAKVRMPKAGDAFSYFKPHFDDWNIALTRKQFFDFWFSAEKKVPEMIAIAKKLKEKRIKLFILSNNFAERANYYNKEFGELFKLFDGIYFSFQMGFVKPNTRAFENILSKNKLRPEECLYFDDSIENVEAAKRLGIAAFVFEGSHKTADVLKKYSLM